MATFDLSGLNKNFRAASGNQDYGFLTDALDIKQSQLEADGKLAPGDYDLLIKQAQSTYAHPGLTPAQRSNILVKIESYRSAKSKTSISDQGNLSELNGNVDDSLSQISMQFSNDPGKYLQAKATLLAAKIDQLSSSIDTLDNAGSDSTGHTAELSKTLNEYTDTTQALDDVKNYPGSGNPTTDYAAYLVTNSKGEVVDMKVDRVGAISGYNETNGVYGGLPVYGKLNTKDATGNKIFKLGSQTYSAPDIVTPNADGTMKASVLFNTKTQKNLKGGYDIATSGYTPINPSEIHTQAVVPQGSWIQGDKGMLYQANGDGTYKKYVNTDKAKLGITDNDIISLPKGLLQTISAKATQTIDGSAPILASSTSQSLAPVSAEPNPTAPQMTPLPAGFGQNNPMQTPVPAAIGRPQTGTPTPSSPVDALNTAAKTSTGLGGILGKIFGGFGGSK